MCFSKPYSDVNSIFKGDCLDWFIECNHKCSLYKTYSLKRSLQEECKIQQIPKATNTRMIIIIFFNEWNQNYIRKSNCAKL